MSYRVRFTLPNGATGVWALTHSTHEEAQRAIDDRLEASGLSYTVEEVTEPGSTAARHVEILRARVNELETELASLKASLAARLQGTAKASEAPGDGGDSDRRRLEALERWLKGGTFRLVQVSIRGTLLARDGTYEKDVAQAPTLAALADKIMEMEVKP